MAQDRLLSSRLADALPREITGSLDPKVVLSSLAAETNRILNATRCSVVRVDPERHPGKGFVFTAVDDPSIEGYALDLANYPEIELALAENRPVRVRDEPGDGVAERIRDRHRKLPFPLSIVLPISWGKLRFGVLFLRFADPNVVVSDEAMALCQVIALGAAIALSSAQQYEVLVAEARKKEHEADELREALRLRIELLSSAAHDLRTPLHSLVGYLDLLDEEAYGPLAPKQHETVGHLLRNISSLLEIVDTLIDHSRLERGAVPLAIASGEISQLLEELRLTIEPLTRGRPIRVEIRTDGAIGLFATDWLKLKRILVNLLHNALKFTERGTISLLVSIVGSSISFVVADTGCGIAEADLPEIFNPFYRGNPTRAEGTGGLGLSIVKRYVEILGGRISVSSRVGEGTRFLVNLPVTWTFARSA
jgi:signal transduction histidine kinase